MSGLPEVLNSLSLLLHFHRDVLLFIRGSSDICCDVGSLVFTHEGDRPRTETFRLIRNDLCFSFFLSHPVPQSSLGTHMLLFFLFKMLFPFPISPDGFIHTLPESLYRTKPGSCVQPGSFTEAQLEAGSNTCTNNCVVRL